MISTRNIFYHAASSPEAQRHPDCEPLMYVRSDIFSNPSGQPAGARLHSATRVTGKIIRQRRMRIIYITILQARGKGKKAAAAADSDPQAEEHIAGDESNEDYVPTAGRAAAASSRTAKANNKRKFSSIEENPKASF